MEAALINTGLQPGATGSTKNKPFQWFAYEEKLLKRLIRCIACNTQLKPCVNEAGNQMIYLSRFSGRHTRRCNLARFNILIHAKEIIGIVFILDRDQPLVIIAVGCFHAPFAFVAHQEVYVGAAG